MTFIYSFLQKRKMHENQHGIIMVVMAYVLSILMLALGSDVFYNINSSAAVNKIEEQEIQQVTLSNTYMQSDTYNQALTLQTKLVNPYNLSEASELEISSVTGTSVLEETVWFLGSAMDVATFDSLMGQLDSIVEEAGNATKEEVSATKTSDKVSDSVKKDIESFSIEVDNTIITLTEEEITMLERIVEAEASGEDFEGKILIANVIFNRIVDEDFPDTVEEVIFQKSDGGYQFSPVANKKYWSVKVSKDTKKAVQRALEGEDYSKGALYFIARKRTSSSSAKWFDNNLKWLFKHGGHEFYKNK